jgi:hypothetical protein
MSLDVAHQGINGESNFKTTWRQVVDAQVYLGLPSCLYHQLLFLMSKYDEKYDSLEPDIIFLKQDERGEEQPGGVWQHSLSTGQLAKGQKTLSPPALLQKVPSAN